MIELENPQIEPVEEAGTYAKYEAGPLQAGYGVTLGNALRRVLLSSLDGAAVTSIQIRDVYQEFSTIPGVKEDVTQIVLNVKKLRVKSFASHPVQLRLIKSGAGPVTAGDITESADVEIVNPELVLMTIDSDDVTIELDLTVTPEEALSRAADILVRQFQPFVNIGLAVQAGDRAAGGVAQLPPN